MSRRYRQYYKQMVTWGEVQDWHDALEQADLDQVVDHDTWGVMSGLVVAQQAAPDFTVQVSDGIAYDENGRKIPVTGGPTTIDLTAQIPAVGGQERYVAIYVETDTTLSDARVDGDGAAIDYQIDESFLFSTVNGTAGAPSQPKPAISANKVLLAVVHLTNGMASILNANISMDWIDNIYAGNDVDRQVGGVPAPGRALVDGRQIVFDASVGEVIQVGVSNHIDCRTGNILKATRLEAADPSTTNYGHTYTNQLTGARDEVVKPWDIPSSSFFPAKQTTDPWSAGQTTDNNWGLATFTTRVQWGMLWNGVGAGGARTGVYLLAPLRLPRGCRLIRASLNLTVQVAFPANLDFKCGVAYQGKPGSAVTTHVTNIYNAGSLGIWTATGSGVVLAMNEAVDPVLDILNDDGYSAFGNSYWIFMYLDDSAGVGNSSFVGIHSATAVTLIREASHQY